VGCRPAAVPLRTGSNGLCDAILRFVAIVAMRQSPTRNAAEVPDYREESLRQGPAIAGSGSDAALNLLQP